MELSFDEVRRIHRLEKNTTKLVEVDLEFYSDLHEFLSKEKQDYLESLKDFSSIKARDFTNLKKKAEEFFALRTRKILGAALVASRTAEPDDSRMSSQEKKLYKEMLSLLGKHNKLLDGVFSDKDAKESERDLNTLAVEVLSDIPEFVGTDMKEYGPFKKGQPARLPVKIARLLISKKLVEEK